MSRQKDIQLRVKFLLHKLGPKTVLFPHKAKIATQTR